MEKEVNDMWEPSNKVGRPPTYNSVLELQEKIKEYFEKGVKVRKVQIGKPPNIQIVEIQAPTITGLCIYLGFESRQSFYDYEEKDEFAYTIKRARLFIENEYEEMLSTSNTTGAIFALKNFGWVDTREIKHELPQGFLSVDPLADDQSNNGPQKDSQP